MGTSRDVDEFGVYVDVPLIGANSGLLSVPDIEGTDLRLTSANVKV
jgi:hypothetical protein